METMVASYHIQSGNRTGLFCHLLTYLDTYRLTYSPGIHTKPSASGRGVALRLLLSNDDDG